MSDRPGWLTSFNPSFPSIQNVSPIEDVVEHQWGMGCICCPKKVEHREPNRGVVAVSIAHNAADGRQ